VPSNQGGPGQEAQTATGTFPWPSRPQTVANPEDYSAYDHTPPADPPVRPANWSNGGGDWKLTSARSTDPRVDMNPQELCGVEGNSVDAAWKVTTGRPDTVIAVTDSGIEWCAPAVVNKIYLNRQALPYPENSAGLTKPQLEAAGVTFADSDPYDLNNSGVFNVAQYANDPRISSHFCAGSGYAGVSPEDLIRAFGQPSSPFYYGHSGPAGFTEAIAGWNFVDDTNDPYDDVHYDHGTGEATDSTGAADALGQEVGTCPNCMVLPIRVGDSFIATGSDFAQGVAFAVDSGANVVQEALGTLDETTSARQAIQYANAHGVPVIASAADEEAEHHNEPANLPGTIVVNSITRAPDVNGNSLYSPPSYLYLNGCTNYGANISVSVESASCSSEATGKTGGVVGLIESAARDLYDAGKLAAYPNTSSATGQPVVLSATEVRELITMAADDVDFQTAAPPFGPPDNYAVVAPVPTTRYPTQPGFDMYTGYGRLNAGRILSMLQQGQIPPEASFGSMDWFQTYDPTSSTMQVPLSAAAVRTKTGRFTWHLQYGIGTQPEPGAWYDIKSGDQKNLPQSVALKPDDLAKIAAHLPPTTDSSGGTGPGGRPNPDAFAFTLRLVVTDAHGLVGMDRRTEFLHHDQTLLTAASDQNGDTAPGAVGFRPGGSVDAPPTLAPIATGKNGKALNALIVATADGDIHAYQANPGGGGVSLQELSGWPVHTAALDSHAGEPAYATGAVTIPRSSIVGGVAVGALGGPGTGVDVVATDVTGHIYAWNGAGTLLWEATTNPAYSGPAVRDPHNRVLKGIIGAPALAHLESSSQLDVVVSSMDRHVYAFRPDGSPVPGWPVLVVDPAQVKSVDPTTHKVTFAAGSAVEQGTKLLDTPAIGDLNGNLAGLQDVVVGSNEEYGGQPNVSVVDPINWAVGQAPLLNPANSRVYAIDPHGSKAGQPNPGAAQPDANAFLPGWPVPIGDFDAGLLPDVGDGTSASPTLADLGSDGHLETGAMTTVGPGYVLKPDGSSYLGTGPDGRPRVLSTQPTGPLSNSPEYPSLPSLGMPVFAPLGATAPGISMIAPATSVGKALDAALPAEQQPNDNQVDAWSTTGHFQAAFPQVMNDLQFIVQPIVANVGGDGAGPYVVEGSATYDIRAINASGQEAPSFPKFTGGWMVNSPSFGPLGDLDHQILAAGTREGNLLIWETSTSACADSGPWPREHHDLWNTGNLQTTGGAAQPAGQQCAGASTGPLPGGALPGPGVPALPPAPPALPSTPPGFLSGAVRQLSGGRL